MSSKKKQCLSCRNWYQDYLTNLSLICNQCQGIYWIYGYRCQDFLKIGYSKNLVNRLANLQVQSPFPISIVYSRLVVGKTLARFVEGEVHKSLKSRRITGEWYIWDDLLLQDLCESVSEVFAMHCLDFQHLENQYLKEQEKNNQAGAD